MLKHAVVNPEGKVINIIIWDGVTKWSPPKDHIAVRNDDAGIDDMYNYESKTFSKSVISHEILIEENKPSISLEDLQNQIHELKSLLHTREK